ncbi:serine carboxypeptidase-like protein 13 [Tanacetum coccineum]
MDCFWGKGRSTGGGGGVGSDDANNGGDHDLMVPYLGTLSWIESLNLSVVDDQKPWYTMKYWNDNYCLTFVSVKIYSHYLAMREIENARKKYLICLQSGTEALLRSFKNATRNSFWWINCDIHAVIVLQTQPQVEQSQYNGGYYGYGKGYEIYEYAQVARDLAMYYGDYTAGYGVYHRTTTTTVAKFSS